MNFSRLWRRFKARSKGALIPHGSAIAVSAILILVAFAAAQPHSRGAVASAETRFVEHGNSGLQIVPASCPSSPHYVGECNPSDRGCSLSVGQSVTTAGTANTISWNIANPLGYTISGSLNPGGVLVSSQSGQMTVAPTQTTTYTLSGTLVFWIFTQGTFSCQNTITICAAGQVVQNGQCVTACGDGLAKNSDGTCTRCTSPFTYDNTVHACTCTSGGSLFADGSGKTCSCPDGLAINSDNTCTRCVAPQTYNAATHACVCSGTGCSCPDSQPPNSDGSCTRCPVNATYNSSTHACQCPTGQFIQGGQCVCDPSAGGCVTIPAPSVTQWQVRPLLVRSGSTTNVSWNVANVQSCTVTGSNGDYWTGSSGAKVSSPITQQTIYRLSCTPLTGSSAAAVNQSAVVNIVPIFNE